MVDPLIISCVFVFALACVAVERRLENTPEFPIGFLVGEISVLVTVAFNCMVLLLGGENLPMMVIVGLVIAHLPFAVVEGVILGFVAGYLARVKPEMLGMARSSTESKPSAIMPQRECEAIDV